LSDKKVKGKAIPVTGRRVPIALWDVEAPIFSRHSTQDGGDVSLTSYPQGDSWYSFLLKAESTPGP
jgi:hypothetical protein